MIHGRPALRLAAIAGSLLLVLLVGFFTHMVLSNDAKLYVVRTGSMLPTIRPGDVVVDLPASERTPVRPGEVVTFSPGTGPDAVVTHRVQSIDGERLITKGDANRTADTWHITTSDLVGRVVATVPKVGYALAYFRQPQGVGSLVTGTFGIALLWSLFFGSAETGDGKSSKPIACRRGHSGPTENSAVATT